MTHRNIKQTIRAMDARTTAQELARRALLLHQNGIDLALDHLRKSLEEGDREAKKRLRLVVRSKKVAMGALDVVSLTEIDPDGNNEPIHHIEIVVGTKPDPIRATDLAAATPVTWRTKVGTLLRMTEEELSEPIRADQAYDDDWMAVAADDDPDAPGGWIVVTLAEDEVTALIGKEIVV